RAAYITTGDRALLAIGSYQGIQVLPPLGSLPSSVLLERPVHAPSCLLGPPRRGAGRDQRINGCSSLVDRDEAIEGTRRGLMSAARGEGRAASAARRDALRAPPARSESRARARPGRAEACTRP